MTLKTIFHRVIGVIGILLALVSAMFVVMAIGDLLGGNAYQTSPSVLWGILVFFCGTLFSGIWMARWGFAPLPAAHQRIPRDEQIKEILRLAQKHQGELSLLQIAAGTQLSLEQSKVLVEELITQNLAQMCIREDGVILYEFPEFRNPTWGA